MNLDVFKYSKKYFQNNFLEWYLMDNTQKKGFSSCIRELFIDLDKIKDMKKGLYDDELFQVLNEYVNRIFTDSERKDCYMLYEYICDISYNLNDLNMNDSIKENINKFVMSELFPQFDLSRLGDDEFNRVIIKYIRKIYDKLYNIGLVNVKLYLNKNIEIFELINNKINFDDMVSYIVSNMFLNYDYDFILNVLKMKAGNEFKNDKIVDVILKYKNEYISSCKKESKDNTYDYVLDVNYVFDYLKNIVMIHYPDVGDEVINLCTNVVYNKLLKVGYNNDEIMRSNMRKVVTSYVDDYFNLRKLNGKMIENSVKRDGYSSRKRFRRNVCSINSSIVTLALVATLVGFVGYGCYQNYVDVRNEGIIKNVSVIDDYRYSDINSIYNFPFERTCENLINSFDEYCEFGDKNFYYLGFYQAYRKINDNNLYVMDKMLVEIEKDIKSDVNHRNLYNSIRYNACYLDFMYDRLYEMGFEEVKERKYQDLLRDYVKLRYLHPYDDLYEYFLPEQRKLLDKVRLKYEELSEVYLVQLGELLDIEDVVRGKSKS